VLTEHNLFAMIGRILARLPNPVWERPKKIKPEAVFFRQPLLHRAAMRARTLVSRKVA
jgi:hypothetical protein